MYIYLWLHESYIFQNANIHMKDRKTKQVEAKAMEMEKVVGI